MDFEKYLQECHADEYIGTDDEMPDAFDDWVSNLEADDLIAYAQAWGDSLMKK